MPGLRAISGREAAGLLAVLGLAAAMRFVGLGTQSYWFDETITAEMMDLSFGRLLESVEDRATPHLYYVVVWAWAQLFGAGEAALRSLSALLGLATVAVLWAAARHAAGSRAAFATAALVAANPMLVWYSQEARTYPLLVLLASVTLLALVLLEERPTARRWALWSIASAAALFTHYFAAFLVLPQLAFLAWRHRGRLRAVALAAVAPALTGLALLPLARSQAGPGTEWIALTPIRQRLEDLLRELVSANTWVVSSSTPPLQRAWWVLAAAGVGVAIACALTARPSPQRRVAAAAAAGGAVVIALPALLAIGSADYLLDRNVIVAWPLLLLALGTSLAIARRPAVGWTALGAIVLVSVGIQAAIVRQPDLQRHDWRGTLASLEERSVPRLILPQPSYTTVPVRHYAEGVQPVDPGAGIAEIVVVGPGVDPDALPPAMHGLPLVHAEREQLVGIGRFRGAEPIELTAEELAALGPGLWQPSARAERWALAALELMETWRDSAARAERQQSARRRLLRAPQEAAALGRAPTELAGNERVERWLHHAAKAARAMGREPSPGRARRLERALWASEG